MKKFDPAGIIILVIALCLAGLTGAGVVISQERAREKELIIQTQPETRTTGAVIHLRPDNYGNIEVIESIYKKFKILNGDTIAVIVTTTKDYRWDKITAEEKAEILKP
jgi:ABC-type amino acid transport substrate-binding protein